MTSGIYFIVHKESLKRYVGQAIDLDKRVKQHWQKLRDNIHDNNHLQSAYNKYGRDAFFVATTPCSTEDLTEREQYFIDTMWDMCYNICKIAGVPPSPKGTKQSTHHIAKRVAKQKGRVNPYKGMPRSLEVCSNISAGRMGIKFSPAYQHADKIRADRAAGMPKYALREKYCCCWKVLKDILKSD